MRATDTLKFSFHVKATTAKSAVGLVASSRSVKTLHIPSLPKYTQDISSYSSTLHPFQSSSFFCALAVPAFSCCWFRAYTHATAVGPCGEMVNTPAAPCCLWKPRKQWRHCPASTRLRARGQCVCVCIRQRVVCLYAYVCVNVSSFFSVDNLENITKFTTLRWIPKRLTKCDLIENDHWIMQKRTRRIS